MTFPATTQGVHAAWWEGGGACNPPHTWTAFPLQPPTFLRIRGLTQVPMCVCAAHPLFRPVQPSDGGCADLRGGACSPCVCCVRGPATPARCLCNLPCPGSRRMATPLPSSRPCPRPPPAHPPRLILAEPMAVDSGRCVAAGCPRRAVCGGRMRQCACTLPAGTRALWGRSPPPPPRAQHARPAASPRHCTRGCVPPVSRPARRGAVGGGWAMWPGVTQRCGVGGGILALAASR